MFGKKKIKNITNVKDESNDYNCDAKASNMRSGSRSTKSCGGKCSQEKNNSSKACHNTRGDNNTKSCS